MPTTRLTLRRVRHPQAIDNYRVWCDDVQVGSIGIHLVAGSRPEWRWGIDGILERQTFKMDGDGVDRADCMRQFRRAWNIFVSDPDRLARFMEIARQRL